MYNNVETNTCNVGYLDEDALLPPRKRLLAGLKRRNSDVDSPASPTPSSDGIENGARLNKLLSSQLDNPDLSYQDIFEASRIAAIEASKIAKAARGNAEEKAEKATKAVAAAMTALELVASIAANKEMSVKKNKSIKHAPVEALCNKNKRKTNCRNDEEVARNLHRAINSSPKMVERLKSNGVVGEIGIEGPIDKIDIIVLDLNTPNRKHNKGERLDKGNLENCEVDKFLDSFS